MAPTGKREIPTALEFMKARQPPQPGTTFGPGGGPNASSGPNLPPKGDGLNNGAKTPSSSKIGTKKGQTTPASRLRGHGRKQTSLLPTKGKAPHAKVKHSRMPTMNAVQVRLAGSGPHGNAGVKKTGGRSGILSKFEGFGSGKAAGRTNMAAPPSGNGP